MRRKLEPERLSRRHVHGEDGRIGPDRRRTTRSPRRWSGSKTAGPHLEARWANLSWPPLLLRTTLTVFLRLNSPIPPPRQPCLCGRGQARPLPVRIACARESRRPADDSSHGTAASVPTSPRSLPARTSCRSSCRRGSTGAHGSLAQARGRRRARRWPRPAPASITNISSACGPGPSSRRGSRGRGRSTSSSGFGMSRPGR